MLSLRLFVLAGALTAAVACSGGDSAVPVSAPTPVPAPTPTPAPANPSSSITIPVGAASLGDRAYAPDSLDVAAGTTVTWMNVDSVPHTSTSDSPGWDSGTVAPGGQFSVALQTAGTFRYHCTIHPGMVGTVVVR